MKPVTIDRYVSLESDGDVMSCKKKLGSILTRRSRSVIENCGASNGAQEVRKLSSLMIFIKSPIGVKKIRINEMDGEASINENKVIQCEELQRFQVSETLSRFDQCVTPFDSWKGIRKNY